jgi:hypothetical protein
MTKKRIIITAAAGLVSFTAAFTLAWLTKTTPENESDQSYKQTLAGDENQLNLLQTQVSVMSSADGSDTKIKKTIKEKQLKGLIYEVREKMQKYDNKLQSLEVREQRLQTAHDIIKKDIEELNSLRIELASIVAGLKTEREKLLKSRLQIAEAEKSNLMSMAATYDKMDPVSAGKILTNICATARLKDGEFGEHGTSLDDAVRILHYMTERTKAKLLAELVTSEPKLSAVLCQRLKQIAEEK